MYAIIETGGKQYRVTPGDVVSLEKLEGNVGQTITLDKVLLVGGQADKQVLVGKPYVPQAKLSLEIVEQTKGEKILTIKYKRRKGYRRMLGHRQLLTRVLVTKIEDGQGHALQFEAAKRLDMLRKASVPYSQRQAKHEAEHAASAKNTKPARKASVSAKEAAPKAAKTSTAKKSAKATTKSTKKE